MGLVVTHSGVSGHILYPGATNKTIAGSDGPQSLVESWEAILVVSGEVETLLGEIVFSVGHGNVPQFVRL